MMDARIGQLLDGTFYAFTSEYRDEPFLGSLREVEGVLGVPHSEGVAIEQSDEVATEQKTFKVLLRFQHPAWDEVDGIAYPDIGADTKAAASAQARRMAEIDGHLSGGKGRVTFTAIEQ